MVLELRRGSGRAAARAPGPDASRHRIWHGLGYCPGGSIGAALGDSQRLGRASLNVRTMRRPHAEVYHACEPRTSRHIGWLDGWDIWRCPDVPGRSAGVAIGIGAGVRRLRRRLSDRGRNPGRQGQDGRQQRRRPGLLRQPALAEVPVLGEVHLVLQRRRAPCRGTHVLQHLPDRPGLDLLDVAIGDGVYLDWLPTDWRIAGVDISRRSSTPAAAATAGRDVRLAQCEAEALPLADRQFDAVPEHRRLQLLQRPRGRPPRDGPRGPARRRSSISDEMPNLTDRMLGHKLGLPALDRWIVSRLMHLGDAFTDMVERVSRPRHPRDRAAACCPTPSSSRCGGASATSWSATPRSEAVAARSRSVVHDGRQEGSTVRFITLIVKNVLNRPVRTALDGLRAVGGDRGRGRSWSGSPGTSSGRSWRSTSRRRST